MIIFFILFIKKFKLVAIKKRLINNTKDAQWFTAEVCDATNA